MFACLLYLSIVHAECHWVCIAFYLFSVSVQNDLIFSLVHSILSFIPSKCGHFTWAQHNRQSNISLVIAYACQRTWHMYFTIYAKGGIFCLFIGFTIKDNMLKLEYYRGFFLLSINGNILHTIENSLSSFSFS